jgi:hypothetical protein
MDPVAQAVKNIIKEQQTIMGPIALEQAKKVQGISFKASEDLEIIGDHKTVLNNLINQYAKIFGQASVQVCKEAFEQFQDKIPRNQVPEILVTH